MSYQFLHEIEYFRKIAIQRNVQTLYTDMSWNINTYTRKIEVFTEKNKTLKYKIPLTIFSEISGL